mgnify:CR=1 FL=1
MHALKSRPSSSPSTSGYHGMAGSIGNPSGRLPVRSTFLLILIMYILCETHQILNFQNSAVIEHRLAGHPPKHLMLVGNDQFHINFCSAVEHRHKIHFKTPICGGKRPRFHIVSLINVEGNVVKLMAHTVVKEHVFARGARIAKAIADIKAEGFAIYNPIAGAQYQRLSYVHTPRPQSSVPKSVSG